MPCAACQTRGGGVDAHHITYAGLNALSKKVSDEFTVPLCRGCHNRLHTHPFGERDYWLGVGIDPLELAQTLWEKTNQIDGDSEVQE